MTASERAKMLRRGIPSAFTVQDPAARQVLEALREAITLLVGHVTSQVEVPAKAVDGGGVKALEEGEGIQIEPLGGGAYRLSCTVQPGSGGGGGGTSNVEALDDLSDVELDSPAEGDALVFDGAKWVSIPSGRPADPSTPATLGQDSEGSSDDAVETTYDATTATSGVSIWVCSRVRYDNAASPPKLYAYMTKLTFPGRIAPTVSGQTRVEVDAPEA